MLGIKPVTSPSTQLSCRQICSKTFDYQGILVTLGFKYSHSAATNDLMHFGPLTSRSYYWIALFPTLHFSLPSALQLCSRWRQFAERSLSACDIRVVEILERVRLRGQIVLDLVGQIEQKVDYSRLRKAHRLRSSMSISIGGFYPVFVPAARFQSAVSCPTHCLLCIRSARI
jgi:hypothetical protein